MERLLLAEIEAEILSDEAVAHAQKAIQDELRRLAKRQRPIEALTNTGKLAQLDAQANELGEMLKAQRLSPTAARAALTAIERERAEIISSANRQDRKASADVLRIVSHGAKLYREAVRKLNTTLTDASERQEARALIRELLGDHVTVRQEGAAVYARLEMDAGVLLAAAANAGSIEINDFQFGSGGSICDFRIPIGFRMANPRRSD